MDIRHAAQTDIGGRWPQNEDAVLVVAEHLLFVVADGMGGYEAGAVASRIAVDAIAETFERNKPRPVTGGEPSPSAELTLEDRLLQAIDVASQRIFENGQSTPAYRGGTATVVVAAIEANRICIAHLGNSCAYRIRGESIDGTIWWGAIERLTRNNSRDGLSMVSSRFHALGTGERVTPDVRRDLVLPNDRFLLCTDGLSEVLDDETIRDTVLRHVDPKSAVAELIDQANRAGSPDNITAALIHFAP